MKKFNRFYLFAVFCGMILFSIHSNAATITVTNNNDAGVGSLRFAITIANAGDTITFDNPYTITLASIITINKNLTIIGIDSTQTIIDGNNAIRIFVLDGGIVNFHNLTIRNARNTNEVTAAILNNSSTITIDKCNFNHNISTASIGVILNHATIVRILNSSFTYNLCANAGGVILNTGSGTIATISNSTFNNNEAGAGGVLYNLGTIGTITNSYFNDNSANNSGVIYNANTINIITNSAFNNNSSTGAPGGVLHNVGTVGTISYSTFYNNTSSIQGGAIYNANIITSILNSTFFANEANTAIGGAICNSSTINNINHSTFIGNSAHNPGGAIYNSGNIAIQNSILVNNTGNSSPNDYYDATSGLTDNGNNCIEYQSGSGNLFNATTDIIWNGSQWERNGIALTNQNINLSTTLADNGGYTQTIAVLEGSFLIGAGNYNLATDQRGIYRSNPPTIGAYGYNIMQSIPVLPVWGIVLLGLVFVLAITYIYKKFI